MSRQGHLDALTLTWHKGTGAPTCHTGIYYTKLMHATNICFPILTDSTTDNKPACLEGRSYPGHPRGRSWPPGCGAEPGQPSCYTGVWRRTAGTRGCGGTPRRQAIPRLRKNLKGTFFEIL